MSDHETDDGPRLGTGRRHHRCRPAARAVALVLLWMIAVTGFPSSAHAADLLWRLTHGDQDALVIGVLTATGGDELQLVSARTLAGLPVAAEVRIRTRADAPPWPQGSAVVASVDVAGPVLTEKWGVFRVSSANPADLTVLEGPLTDGELAAFQRYLNSDGRDSEFTFIADRVYVKKSGGSLELIYAAPETSSDTSSNPTTPRAPTETTGWNLGYLAGAAGVLVVILILFRFRPRPPAPRPPASS